LTELLAAIEPQPASDDAHCPDGHGGREGSGPDMAPSGS
jgi:hypothetical protein